MNILVVGLADAAKMLKVSEHEFRKKVEAGEVPAYRDGYNWKIPKTLLQAYVENKAIAEAKERKRVHESGKI